MFFFGDDGFVCKQWLVSAAAGRAAGVDDVGIALVTITLGSGRGGSSSDENAPTGNNVVFP